MNRRIVLLSTCAALAAGGTLAACGSDSNDSKPPPTQNASQVFAAAASATANATSFKLNSSTKVNLGGKDATISFDGVADTKAKTSELNLDLSSLAQAAGPAVSLLGGADSLKGQLVTNAAGGLVTYIKLPLLNEGFAKLGSKNLPAWGKIDFEQIGDLAGIDFAALANAGGSSQQAAGLLKKLAGTPKAVGTETVGGTKTTHYRANVDFAKPVSGLPADVTKSLDQIATLAKQQGGSTTFPVDVWIDGDNLVRKESYAQKVAGGQSVTTTLQFSDYNRPVTVTIPPASQTWDILKELEARRPGTLAQLKAALGAATGGGAGAATGVTG